MNDLPADYLEKQARWVKRMQKAGLFPPDAPEAPPAPAPLKGQWSAHSMPDGQVYFQANDVEVPDEIALEIFKIFTRKET